MSINITYVMWLRMEFDSFEVVKENSLHVAGRHPRLTLRNLILKPSWNCLAAAKHLNASQRGIYIQGSLELARY
ncbi:uncharacterized protein N7483_006434 [Penicillium malachiteum]|uniref:uncharacterized protein n=1 Tax=Penicillium malachiteum TaxID=1324776 RepID=UPI0025469634|nr:uncharacterized protein N7483_006434 [Penicillium malachiteum]KAJ5725077.1 hypothetical protein N7483_006434 [Penicillium malachiteum]